MNLIFATACLACACAASARPQYGGSPNYDGASPNYGGPSPNYGGASPAAYRKSDPPVVPVILPGGFIADTEEVARAKEYHLSAFAHAATNVKEDKYSADYSDQYTQPKYTGYTAAPQTYTAAPQAYTAAPQQLFSAAHAQAYSAPQRQQNYNVPQQRYTGPASDYGAQDYQGAKAVAYQQPAYSSKPRYNGPPVIPVILPNGYLAETADVEAAKQHHFQLVQQAQEAVARADARAKASGYAQPGYAQPAYAQPAYAQPAAAPTPAYSNKNYDDGQYNEAEDYSSNQVYQAASAPAYKQARQPYQGPQAVPVVLPTGHIADTAEVAAAKISHLQQLLDAAQKSLPQQRYSR